MRPIPGFLCGTQILTRNGYVPQEEYERATPLLLSEGTWMEITPPPIDWYWGDDLIWITLSTGHALKLGKAQLLLTRARKLIPAERCTPDVRLMTSSGEPPYPTVVRVVHMPVTGRLFAYRHFPDMFISVCGILAPCGGPQH